MEFSLRWCFTCKIEDQKDRSRLGSGVGPKKGVRIIFSLKNI
jgi:hypothetical protein